MAAYKSISDGKSTFRRDVWHNKRWLGLWHFLDGENADHVVRGILERRHGPGNVGSVIVGDRDSPKPRMWESFEVEKPHDVP
jgi:hypothetical protein